MKVYDERKSTAEEISRLLEKKSFDEVKLSPKVAAAVEKMFGRPLTAAEEVDIIVNDIRNKGDEALFEYTKKLDGADLRPATIRVTEEEFAEAEKAVDEKTMGAIRRAIANVRKFHEEQLPKTWLTPRAYGSFLGQKMTPVDSVGIYVPGGTAAYPSSVIMNAVPAKVAGVPRIAMAAPAGRDGKMNPYVLATAKEIGITEIYKMGGAQAIAALAFGTETIPKVEKITGPGNIFVTLAKKAVYGHVDIDMLAGPSEILIVADKTADYQYLAADLLSQAEHDPLACAILITDDEDLAGKVAEEVEVQLQKLPRKEIAAQSLAVQGKIILAKDMDTVVEMANISAPEHMEINTREPFALVPRIRNAGAIFLGAYSPEPLGDYYAGPNHILPTGGTARFYSVLNVETFMKKTSIISYTKEALAEAADDIIAMAEAEGLQAHANAIRIRKGAL
ncbi:histidinol dehydrogenase [Acidaminococcus fermentans]|uniref:Histidinol dehydrogenase n=1 Tax=Acidaminococcus fermentans (strain ATCC 25085 / DSM 20731 / CCUG 9996 / CIP 106432 / VR4) TaxID=591001 RepID=D2RJQ0_ACIFV|nr:histidinol dehydrogenase [Acidaminococcus fermentans]ADB47302.1 histidinol dehydrogenase [Acidaminococcus fermentans DSM 20731]MCI6286273.1 histidinol dehydrogenase [Acidaminococcus fermentans]MDY2852919.1 histidinol dehydrogenase [Acidaminococcus fermentans]UEA72095.1 histidinol dehydrogenase [Acidaminococcus fermentans DSM 20731]